MNRWLCIKDGVVKEVLELDGMIDCPDYDVYDQYQEDNESTHIVGDVLNVEKIALSRYKTHSGFKLIGDIEKYQIAYDANGNVFIGCNLHLHPDMFMAKRSVWENYPDRAIELMDVDALDFWQRNKEKVFMLLDEHNVR